jgi:hypothetical protein
MRKSTRSGRVATALSLMAAACLVASCATADPNTPIARVTEAQGEAFITRTNGASEPADLGDLLLPGDGFRTGAGTMKLTAMRGGTVDVYPNTDPFVEESLCFAISFFKKGKIRILGSGMCVNGVYQKSDVGYEMLGPDTMRIWVREGEVRQLIPPFATITTGNRGDLAGGQIVNRAAIAPGEFESRFPPLPAASPNPVIL